MTTPDESRTVTREQLAAALEAELGNERGYIHISVDQLRSKLPAIFSALPAPAHDGGLRVAATEVVTAFDPAEFTGRDTDRRRNAALDGLTAALRDPAPAGLDVHGFTCEWCQWGRDSEHARYAWVMHMEHVHPEKPPPPRLAP